MIIPNLFAYVALLVWPIVTVVLFTRLPSYKAFMWSLLGAYLFLPLKTSFEIPVIPSLDKATIPNLAILACCAIFVRERWLRISQEPILMALAALFIVSPFLTAQANPEPLLYGDRFIPGMSWYDAGSQAVLNVITLIPFVVAHGLVRSEERRWSLIAILVSAALVYSVLMLIEIRLSPQLHNWLYGFFPHSFAQQVRAGGFRAVVFLGHGLLVAFFCAVAVLAATARWRAAKGSRRSTARLIMFYLAGMLILCKTLGAVLLAMLFAPAVALARPRTLGIVCGLACAVVLFYPAFRASNIIPVRMATEVAQSVSADRAESLVVRLENEERLLHKASDKPISGWGSWGRSRIYSEDDGRDMSTTDGAWIITLGSWGWAGYIAMFGLIGFGCIRMAAVPGRRRDITLSVATLCAILSINLLDAIPNSSISPLTWLIAGAVAGVARSGKTKPSNVAGLKDEERMPVPTSLEPA